jgi:hypothetical protein
VNFFSNYNEHGSAIHGSFGSFDSIDSFDSFEKSDFFSISGPLPLAAHITLCYDLTMEIFQDFFVKKTVSFKSFLVGCEEVARKLLKLLKLFQ